MPREHPLSGLGFNSRMRTDADANRALCCLRQQKLRSIEKDGDHGGPDGIDRRTGGTSNLLPFPLHWPRCPTRTARYRRSTPCRRKSSSARTSPTISFETFHANEEGAVPRCILHPATVPTTNGPASAAPSRPSHCPVEPCQHSTLPLIESIHVLTSLAARWTGSDDAAISQTEERFTMVSAID